MPGPFPSGRHRLAALSSNEVDPAAWLLIPLGSTEQHGPHLPVDTDTRIAVALADGIASELHRAGHATVVVAPPLAYGASGEHHGFAGTLSVGTEALVAMMIELARSVRGQVERLVFVNGHGGNAGAVNRAVDQLRREDHPVTAVAPRWDGDAHAGRVETSLLLYLCPTAVRVDRFEPGRTEPLDALLPELERLGMRAVSANGILGDPTPATAEAGRTLFHSLVETMAREVAGDLPSR